MISLDEAITVTGTPKTALERADLVLAAVPTQFVRSVWDGLAPPSASTPERRHHLGRQRHREFDAAAPAGHLAMYG